MEKISTSKLSKKLNISAKELFDKLVEEKLIYREDYQWVLTKKGGEFGGEMVFSKKYGDFIVWPPDFNPINLQENKYQNLINATEVGKNFDIPAQRMNLILLEIGWIEKAIKGWSLTSLGKGVGGVQFESTHGTKYVMWPKQIINNKSLLYSTKDSNEQEIKAFKEKDPNDFRTKFPANKRTKDGHMVRSKAEMIIDNYLYVAGLAHAYERRVPIEEDMYTDFYIPRQNGGEDVYIEYWGYENNPKYSERKKRKQHLYSKSKLNLIELEEKHIENLDDYLPRMLMKFGIKTN